ncbi:MAG: heme ABC transporter permease [Gammaproteobacteria bacterium]|nr:heme ABC transporter permease [Gammaproteobacteria bacterium]
MGSPKYFYEVSGKMIPWFMWTFIITLVYGLYQGMIVSPPDYQQGESVRIMYIHVPAAWMSMFIYVVMAVSGLISLVWRIKMTEIFVISSATVGASFTFLALATGSLWGKPMWGTWWVWDARLTSELILLFLYLGIIALHSAIEDKRVAARAISILALVGVVNIPIIHYSVEWWNTLHQTSSVTMTGKKAMSTSMLIPLLVMSVSFKLYYGAVVLMRARAELLERDRNTRWVEEVVQEDTK